IQFGVGKRKNAGTTQYTKTYLFLDQNKNGTEPELTCKGRE
ncbi:24195_t:CDS:1, partial [Dentiscutata erythropus]